MTYSLNHVKSVLMEQRPLSAEVGKKQVNHIYYRFTKVGESRTTDDVKYQDLG